MFLLNTGSFKEFRYQGMLTEACPGNVSVEFYETKAKHSRFNRSAVDFCRPCGVVVCA